MKFSFTAFALFAALSLSASLPARAGNKEMEKLVQKLVQLEKIVYGATDQEREANKKFYESLVLSRYELKDSTTVQNRMYRHHDYAQEAAYSLLELQSGKDLEPYKERNLKSFLSQMEYGHRALIAVPEGSIDNVLMHIKRLRDASEMNLREAKRRAKSSEGKGFLLGSLSVLIPSVNSIEMVLSNSSPVLGMGGMIAASVGSLGLGLGYYAACMHKAGCAEEFHSRVESLYYTLKQFDEMRIGMNRALSEFQNRRIYAKEARVLRQLSFDSYLDHVEMLQCNHITN